MTSSKAALRFRRFTALLALLWAVFELGVSVYTQLTQTQSVEPPLHTTTLGGIVIVSSIGAEARAAGVQLGHRVIRVEHQAVHQWYRARGWDNVRADKAVHYRLEDEAGRAYEIALPPRAARSIYELLQAPLFAALTSVGMVFLLVALFVWRLREGNVAAWTFLLFSCAIATSLFGAINPYDSPLGYERMIINLPLIGATMFHLFSVFPVEPAWIARRPYVRALPYLSAALFAAAVVAERASGAVLPGISSVAYAIGLCGALAAIGVLIAERLRMHRRGADAAAKKRANIVLIGTLISFLPLAFMTTAYLVTRFAWPYALGLLWFIAFPLSVAYGIVRGRFFDVRRARRARAYRTATWFITVTYALAITFTQTLFLQFNMNDGSPAFLFIFLFFAILAFGPLRHRLQGIVDRLFDRDRARYRRAVREISDALVAMLSLREIGERLLQAMSDTLGINRAMGLMVDDAGRSLRPVAWRGDWKAPALEFTLAKSHPIRDQLWTRRRELSRADIGAAKLEPQARARCLQVFDLLEVQLLVPIIYGVDLLGVIAVGAKLTGEGFGADDRQLLRTFANQSAIAMENAQAFDEIAKLNATLEARVAARTRELQETQTQLMQSEKIRSLGQLVAGVAHELNNPIGFVHANLQLVDGYIKKLLQAQQSGGDAEAPRAAIAKLLARSREGTERVKGIVMNLRAFSRMDQAELSDADLNQEIERTLGLMAAHLKGGIKVHKQFGPLPPVRCFPAQLNQVFMNLIINACDALQSVGGGEITVRTGAQGRRGVQVDIADTGPGIAPENQARIFEPFFTTKAVGQGTGLGLSISHGIVERHGGRLLLSSPAEGGAHFRIELPLVANPPKDSPKSEALYSDADARA